MTATERRRARVAKARAAKEAKRDPDALTGFQELFVHEYVNNGGNATAAYRSAHNGGVKDSTAAVEACKLLRTPKIRAALEATRQERIRQLAMEGDEAIALLSLRARADIAQLYDEKGELLPIHQIPESVRLAIKSIKGDGTVVLHDGLKAAELMAIATGRLKNTLNLTHNFDHARHLAGLDNPEGPEPAGRDSPREPAPQAPGRSAR